MPFEVFDTARQIPVALRVAAICASILTSIRHRMPDSCRRRALLAIISFRPKSGVRDALPLRSHSSIGSRPWRPHSWIARAKLSVERTGAPSAFRIRSPGCRPASAAGENMRPVAASMFSTVWVTTRPLHIGTWALTTVPFLRITD